MARVEKVREKQFAEELNRWLADLSDPGKPVKVWERARIVTGRLIEIDRTSKLVKVQHKNGDGNKWITESFRTPDSWDLFDYEAIKVALGQEIELVTEDNRVLEWKP